MWVRFGMREGPVRWLVETRWGLAFAVAWMVAAGVALIVLPGSSVRDARAPRPERVRPLVIGGVPAPPVAPARSRHRSSSAGTAPAAEAPTPPAPATPTLGVGVAPAPVPVAGGPRAVAPAPVVDGSRRADADGDWLSTARELRLGTNPKVADTDGDGMPDGFEVHYRLQPRDAVDAPVDSDDDGVSNVNEFRTGSSPRAVDSNYDGIDDGADDTDGTV